MNYRHAFHAGNFADLLKHAAFTSLIAQATGQGGPVQVIDTHAGAGAYDIAGQMALRSGEAAAGIGRLMQDAEAPAAFDALKAAVEALNRDGALNTYPGSPVLAARALRPGDRYAGYELREDDHAALVETLSRYRGAAMSAMHGDGYEAAARFDPAARTLLLIDPPFERGDEYRRIVQAVGAALACDATACIAVWLPLKDLDTFDRFISAIEQIEPDLPATLVCESRLRPLDDPMKMNGCAMVVVNASAAAEADMLAAAQWMADRLGEAGAEARAWQVGGA